MSSEDHHEIAADDVLSFRSFYKEYPISRLHDVFADIAEFVDVEKVSAEKFRSAVLSCGSHSAKYPNSRSSVGGLIFPPQQRSNAPSKSFFSGNAANATFAKILLRPIKVENQESEACFLDRITSGDPYAEDLEKSFCVAFGEEALEAVKQALIDRHYQAGKATIRHENMPVVYIPGPDGDDLLTTPLAPIAALKCMQSIKYDAYQDFTDKRDQAKSTGDNCPVTSGRWIRTIVSGKMRNVVMNLGDNQYRFFSEMNNVLVQKDSDFIAISANPGWFPRFYDVETAEALVSYATRLEHHRKQETYVSQNMSAGTDRLADMIISAALSFIDEVVDGFLERYPDGIEPSPDILDVLKTLPVQQKDRVFATASLNTTHFKGRLEAAGVRA